MALAEAFSPKGTLWRHLKESSNYSLALLVRPRTCSERTRYSQAGNYALRAPMGIMWAPA